MDCIQPVRCSEVDLLLHRLTTTRRNINQLEASDAGAFHPLEILGDPVQRHISIGPMPPCTRLRRLWRILESLNQILARRLRYRYRRQERNSNSGKLLHRLHSSGSKLWDLTIPAYLLREVGYSVACRNAISKLNEALDARTIASAHRHFLAVVQDDGVLSCGFEAHLFDIVEVHHR